jgi:hypothetical protein
VFPPRSFGGVFVIIMLARRKFTAPKSIAPKAPTVCSACNKTKPLANKTKKLCITCSKKLQVQKAKDKKEKVREKKRLSLSSLTKKLDTIFSVYIRLLHADKNGMVRCFTCDRLEYWRKIQNGHFQSRRFMSTRFHVGNCAPQCYACNVGMSGMQYEYGKRLDLKYGSGMADDMVAQSRIIRKFTPDELLEKIQETESAVNFLRQSKSIWD